jgi:site-specific recombinase XerD
MGVAKNNGPGSEMDLETMRDLRESWIIAMQAARTPRNTLLAYSSGLRLYLDWCQQQEVTEGLAEPEQVRRYLAHLAALGRSSATINARLSALRVFAQWALRESELAETSLDRVQRAAKDKRIPDYLSEEQKDMLLATCAGNAFADVRDAAIISLMFDSLLRADEAVSLRARGDVDLRRRSVRVRRGKGAKERSTGFSPQTAMRLDRYQRARGRHRHAGAETYWIGKHGPFRYPGLYEMIKRRGRAIGLDLHPHVTRNGGAIDWKLRGGSTEGLMAIGGWESLEMVQHYVRAAEIELALAEQQRLYQK